MSSGRGIFLFGIIAIGLFNILSVLGISWLLEPQIHPISPVSRREQQTFTPAPSEEEQLLETAQLTDIVEDVVGGG